jgi:site-specific DNA recombinase
VKAAAYLRVSTEGQTGEDTFGVAAQEEAIKGYAAAKGIEVVTWYKDEGISGATLDRPGLQQLMTDAGRKGFDILLVAKMDRVARDLFAALFIEKELLINDVEIISVSEPVSGRDPMNTAFRQMMGVFAELEKSMITARMTGGRKQKARGGGYAGGGAAIGYKAIRGGKALQLDRDKALTVKRVFELKEEKPSWTLQQLADKLNKEGHTTAQGKQFKSMQVKRILDRQGLYSGIYTYSGIEAEGQHEAII